MAKDAGDDDEAAKERQQQARRTLVEGIDAARDALLKELGSSSSADAAAAATAAEAAVRDRFASLARKTEEVVSAVFDADSDMARRKIKFATQWNATKMESARVAAEIRMKQRAVEVTAACNAEFDEVLKEIARGGSELERQLVARLDALTLEVEHLRRCEQDLADVRRRLTESEEERKRANKEFSMLSEDCNVCIKAMSSLAKKDLATTLKAEQILLGDPPRPVLRDVLTEFANE